MLGIGGRIRTDDLRVMSAGGTGRHSLGECVASIEEKSYCPSPLEVTEPSLALSSGV